MRFFNIYGQEYTGPVKAPVTMQREGFIAYDGDEPSYMLVYDNGVIRAKTEEEQAAELAQQEDERQASKPLRLKRNENAYLLLLASLPVEITEDDDTVSVAKKLEASGTQPIEALTIAMKLQAAMMDIMQAGGTWYDLPKKLHELPAE